MMGDAQLQSSLAVFLSCPKVIGFALPENSSSCGSGDYSAVYTGTSQTVSAYQDSVFYLSNATGGVKVVYALTDSTTNQLVESGKAYGSISGGDCTTPSVVVGNVSVAVGTSVVISSGDTLKAFLNITFTGTGTPVFCSGGSSATLILIQTAPVSSTGALLTTTLTAGRAQQTTIDGYPGVSIPYLNTASSAMNALVYGTVRNNAGAIVGYLLTTISLLPTQNVTASLVLYHYAPATYTITIIATTPVNVPVSTPVTANVTV